MTAAFKENLQHMRLLLEDYTVCVDETVKNISVYVRDVYDIMMGKVVNQYIIFDSHNHAYVSELTNLIIDVKDIANIQVTPSVYNDLRAFTISIITESDEGFEHALEFDIVVCIQKYATHHAFSIDNTFSIYALHKYTKWNTRQKYCSYIRPEMIDKMIKLLEPLYPSSDIYSGLK